MEEKKKSFPFTIVRHIVQVIVLAVFLAPVFLAGWNLFGGTVGGDNAMGTPADVFFYGSLSSSSIFGINLLDPFAFLQYVVASKSLALNALLAWWRRNRWRLMLCWLSFPCWFSMD